MAKRDARSRLPEADTSEFEECLRILREGSVAEVTAQAHKLGYAHATSFMTVMGKLGHHRVRQQSAPKVVQPARTIERDVQLEKALADIRYYKQAYTESLKRMALGDVVAEAMREAAALVPALTVKT